MQPANIVTIVVAGISAIVSLGTVAWVSFKSKFQDKQNSTIKLITKKSDEETYAEIIIDFTNDESFSQKATSFKNGKDSTSADNEDDLLENTSNSPNFNSLPNLKKMGTKVVKKVEEKFFEDDKIEKEDTKKIKPLPKKFLSKLKSEHEDDLSNISFVITENDKAPNFTNNALETNKEGDKLIASNRDNLLKKGLYVYHSVIKTVFPNETGKVQESDQNLKIPQHGQSKLSIQANSFFGSSVDGLSNTQTMRKNKYKGDENEENDTIIDFTNDIKNNKVTLSNTPGQIELTGINTKDELHESDDN